MPNTVIAHIPAKIPISSIASTQGLRIDVKISGYKEGQLNIGRGSIEAAQYLKVKPRTVPCWAKRGRIPGHPLSGAQRITWRFLRAELDAMLALPSAAGHGRVQCAAE